MGRDCSGFRGGRGETAKKGKGCENERKSAGVGDGVGGRSNGGSKGGED